MIIRFLLVTLFVLFFNVRVAKAELDTSQIVLPGFQDHTTGSDLYKCQSHIFGNSSALVTELDGDTSNGQELAFLSGDDSGNPYVCVLSSSGHVRWRQKVVDGNTRYYSSIAAGRLNGKSSTPAVVVALGYGQSTKDSTDNGKVVAMNGANGKTLFTFDSRSYGKQQRKKRAGYNELLHSIISTPALADVNHDGKLEIGFGGHNRHIFLLNNKGRVLWYYQTADTVWSSPAFANLQGDRNLEMIIGTDISKNTHLKPATPNGGYIYSLKTNLNNIFKKKSNLLVPFRSKKAYSWYKSADQTFFSSPVVADIHPSFKGKEIVIGTGHLFPQGIKNKNGRNVKVYAGKNGKLIAEIPTNCPQDSSVAVADVDFDGVNEIIIYNSTFASYGCSGPSTLNAWKANKTTKKFDQIWSNNVPSQPSEYVLALSSPIVADLDGNGSLEVIIQSKGGIKIFNGASGSIINTGKKAKILPKVSDGTTPVAADINNDGILELVIRDGGFIPYTNFHLWLNSEEPPSQKAVPYAAPWAMWRGNAQRTGTR